MTMNNEILCPKCSNLLHKNGPKTKKEKIIYWRCNNCNKDYRPFAIFNAGREIHLRQRNTFGAECITLSEDHND